MWRGRSREAAEEVFRGVRERVDRMGGVGGLRDRNREREGREKGGGWGWDEREGGVEGGDEEGDGDERAVRKDELGNDDGDYGDEEGGYTMDMMLGSLNVELGVIGFDRAGQRWVD